MKHSWHDPHIARAVRTLSRAVYITSGVFLSLFVLFHIGGALYASSLATKSSEAFHVGINKDLAHLKKQGDEVAKNDAVQRYLIEKDSEKLIDVLQAERAARSIGLMGVADSEGVIIGRTKSSGVRGDNVFLTNPVGRAVSKGESVQSVEITIGFAPKQLYLATGRPIMRDGEMIGALFSNYLTDNDYAVRFRDNFLPSGSEVVFYTKRAGVYGNSFADPEIHNLVNSYFNSGSDWIQKNSSGQTISFGDGNFYLVENISFPGLEESPGGALIFIPRRDISGFTNTTLAVVTLMVFLFLAFRYHRHTYGEERGWRYYVLVLVISFPVFVVAFFALYLQNFDLSKLERIPYPIYNSTLHLQPEFGVYDADFEQKISVVVDTGDEAINAVQFGLLFKPDHVEIKSVEAADSACSYVIENKIDQEAGRIDFSCVIVENKGGSGSLRVADLIIVPHKVGIFDLSFDNLNSKVLASDGLGTDVLRVSQSGSYSVESFDSAEVSKSLIVFSPTHPNQIRWYNKPNARFVWRGEKDAVYRYGFDNLPDTVPSGLYTTQGSVIDIPVPGDGIFYFHLQSVSGGKVAHYKVQSDMSPPSIVSVKLSADNVFAGDVVRLSFEAKDVSSGIQKNYYVDLGDHLFLPVGSQLFIPFLEAGNQKVILRVYDGAGNYAEETQFINVRDK